MHSIEVVAFVAEFAPITICKWNLHLYEKNLFQCSAKIFRHIGCICQFIQTTASIRLCIAQGFYAVLGFRFGNCFQVCFVSLSAKYKAHTSLEERVP